MSEIDFTRPSSSISQPKEAGLGLGSGPGQESKLYVGSVLANLSQTRFSKCELDKSPHFHLGLCVCHQRLSNPLKECKLILLFDLNPELAGAVPDLVTC